MLDSAQSQDGTHETAGVSLPNLSASIGTSLRPPATAGTGWIGSSKKNPCPICSRTKDGDCRTKGNGAEMRVICHKTTGHTPGETIKVGETEWAFTGVTDDGRGGHFKVDTPRPGSAGNTVRPFVWDNPADRRASAIPAPQPDDQPILARLGEPVPAAGSPYAYGPTMRSVRTDRPDGSKVFRVEHLAGDAWTAGAGPQPWPLFMEPAALQAIGWPLELEGEKCAELAAAAGIVAISQPGHAHKVDQIRERYARLQGAGVPGVVYLADHDEQGEKRAQQAVEAAALAGLPLLVIRAGDIWPGLPAGGSIDDAPGTAAEQIQAIEQAAAAAHVAVAQQQEQYEIALSPQPAAGGELQQRPKRRTLAPDEVMALTPARLGGVPRLNIRTNDFHAGNRAYTADDLSRLYVHLSSETERWPKDTTADVVVELAKDRAFDPVEEELNHLGETVEPLPLEQWQRLDQHLLGIDDPIAAAFLPQFLISAVARVFRPGCGVRRAPVLIGPQWRGKTRLGRILFGVDHWVENVHDLGKDDLLRLQAGWGIELSELDGISRRKDVEAIKAFLTATQDVFRAPYGKGVSRYDRRCVFWGTSNGPPLRDLSGSTRFVCISLPDQMLPLDWAVEHRSAIWSRAVQQFRLIPHGEEPWDRSSEEERQAIAERNLNFQQEDPLADEVAEILANAIDLPMTTPRILDAMDFPKSQRNNVIASRIRQLAELAGWVVDRRKPLDSSTKKKGFWPAEPGHTGHTGHTAGHTEDTPANTSHSNGLSQLDTPDTPNQSNFEKKEEQGHSSAPTPAIPEPPEACADTFELFGVSGVSTSPNTSEGLPSSGHTRCVSGVSCGVSSVCPAPKNAPEPPAWLPQALELRAANPPGTHAYVLVHQAPLSKVPGLTGAKVKAALAAHDQQQGEVAS